MSGVILLVTDLINFGMILYWCKHYVNNGYSEGRSKDSFDEWSYLASNGDLITAFGNTGVLLSITSIMDIQKGDLQIILMNGDTWHLIRI